MFDSQNRLDVAYAPQSLAWPCSWETLQQSYARDGFVVVKGLLPKEVVVEADRQLRDYIEQQVPRLPPMDVFYQHKGDSRTITMLPRLAEHSPYFSHMLRDSPISMLAQKLLGAGAVPQNAEYFDKPAGSSHVTPPHQDGYYFHLSPCEALTVWMPLDVVDASNGCVRYVLGSHGHGMRRHGRTEILGFSQGIVDYDDNDRSREVLGVVEPGDVIVHDAMTIHRADANPSEHRSRRAIACVYYSQAAQVDHAAARAYHEKLEKEWSAQGRI